MTAGTARVGWLAAALLSATVMSGCGKVTSTKGGSGGEAALASPVEKRGQAATTDISASAAERAIEQARRDGKYAFILFYRPSEQADSKMKDTFSRAQASLSAKAVFLAIDVNSSVESRLIEKYRARQVPLPLTLVGAPNGAIVGAFTKAVDEETLAGAFVSPKVAQVAKALQSRKLVVLCLQGSGTKHNRESSRAAQQFVADPRLAGQAMLIAADPAQEAGLLKRCGINSAPAESSILLLLPPGNLVATVAGATTKEVLLAKLQTALAACGSGCGPSGCTP